MKTKIYLSPLDKGSFMLDTAVELAQNKIDTIEKAGGKIQDVQFPRIEEDLGYRYLIVAKIKSY